MKETKRTILIVSLSVIVLFLISAGTYILILNKERAKLTIKNNVSYTLPSGWTEETISEKEVILKSSNDISAKLSVQILTENQTIDSERYLQENTTGFSDISYDTLDTLPAIRYHTMVDDVVNALHYFVIKDNYSLLVTFDYMNTDVEIEYYNQIDEVLRNIHLK